MASALGPRGAELFRPSLWWMVPAWLVGRVSPNLGRTTDADAKFLLSHSRLTAVVLPVAAVVLALVPSVLHATNVMPHAAPDIDFFRIGMDDVYTESLAFMIAAFVLGLFSPALGAFLVLVFSAFDLVAAAAQPNELRIMPWSVLGRLIGYWLLWLLVVEIPVFSRTLVESATVDRGQRLRAAVVGGAVVAGFGYLWTQATGTLIRAVFSFAGLVAPKASAVYPLQTVGWVLAVIGGVTALLVILLRGPDKLLGWRPSVPILSQRPEIRFARHVLLAALLTLGTAGLILSLRDAVLLFAGFVLAQPVAAIVVQRSGLGRLIYRLPTIPRIALSVAAAFAVAFLVVPRLYSPNDYDYLSVIVGLIAATFAIQLILANRRESALDQPPPAPSPAVVGIVAALGLILLSYLLPELVSADNCATAGDCYGLGAGAAVAAAGAAAALNSRRSPSPPAPPPPPSPPPLEQYQNYPPWNPMYWQQSGNQMSDEANWGPTSPIANPTGACVLTTTCVYALGKPDDCHELQMWRRMRDEYLRWNADGMAVIEDYYRTAPKVIAAVLAKPDSAIAWRRIYDDLVEPVVKLVDNGQLDKAADVAKANYESIKAGYAVI